MKTAPVQARTVFSLGALTLFITGAVLYAGPLNPPDGPVSSTAKTLTEVEPRIAINATNTPGDAASLFKITQPGSYYLTGNITGVAGRNGIGIAVSGVTLDLNGFDLIGVPASGFAAGVRATVSGLTNINVVNGSIRNWGEDGINLSSNVTGCRIEGVQASGNVRMGIYTGLNAVVSKCTTSNGMIGIQTQSGSTVSDCSTTGHTDFGIAVAGGSAVKHCTSYLNTGFGIVVGSGCTVTNCSAYQNTADGIDAGSSCTITNCTAYDNLQEGIFTTGGNSVIAYCSTTGNNRNGIRVGSGSTVSNCVATSNAQNGIFAVSNCTIINCTASSNSVNGIVTTDGCNISACTVTDNIARGISANNGCQITDCITRNNQADGIAVNFSCNISGNTCNGDGTAASDHGAIRVLGQANRIDENNISFADRGLMISSGGNVVVRNSVRGCTVNLDIVGGNDVGPIGSAATATSPWANIQF